MKTKLLLLRILDLFFHLLHLSIIFFIMFGWIFRETRLANLILIGMTVFSWYGLGLFLGFGYCPVTDWHWKIKKKLGEWPLTGGYVKYAIDRLTGMDISAEKADTLTSTIFFCTLLISLALNIADHLKP